MFPENQAYSKLQSITQEVKVETKGGKISR